jgi:selenide,water dikinase
VADDAAVYRIADDLAIVVTVDFFTPIVDDPYAYGAIAAANSLSDVYAMGGRPLLALNVAALSDRVPVEVSAEIFRGGAEKAKEAGIRVAGGHTVKDDEPKYGLAVVGTIHPNEVTRRSGARPGDRLLLSKPLGTGVITTGLMRDSARLAEIEAATSSMMRLNDVAAEIGRACDAGSVTDITGFGLLGHAAELAVGDVGLSLSFSSLPWLPGSRRLGAEMTFAGGAHDNRRNFGAAVTFDASLEEWEQLLCFSPETSGGLLMAVGKERSAEALELAAARRLPLADVGEVVSGSGIRVTA